MAEAEVTFQGMVFNLFKKMPGHGARMLHAAIGIAGETGELRGSLNRANLKEECGDLEFYMEAAWQAMEKFSYLDAVSMYDAVVDARGVAIGYGNVIDNIHTLGADILDNAKKVWVYEDGNRDQKIAALLLTLEQNLTVLYSFMGWTRDDVRADNMRKLLTGKNARYASGTYSNAEALAKADHVAAMGSPYADRSFIGKPA